MTDEDTLIEYDRYFYRSSLVSLFWSVIQARKKSTKGFRLADLASRLKIDKSTVSRWFSTEPNWEANTVAEIANALDVELRVVAVDRIDGKVYTPTGVQNPVEVETRVHNSIVPPENTSGAMFSQSITTQAA